MRFMLLARATPESEAGMMPSEEEFTAMGKFNEKLADSGRLEAAEGLHPTSKSARVTFENRKPSVKDGPFAETKELVAGYWVIRADSMDEAVELAKSAPFHHGTVEVRQIFEAEDFGDSLTPELREQEKRVRARAAAQR
jgi:hypothetical protein